MPPPRAAACTNAWASRVSVKCGSTRAPRSHHRPSRSSLGSGCARRPKPTPLHCRALDAAARGMHREALIDELLRDARSDGCARSRRQRAWIRDVASVWPRPRDRPGGRARRRRRESADRASRRDSTRAASHASISISTAVSPSGSKRLGLLRVDAPTTMLRGAPLPTLRGVAAVCHRHPGIRLMRPAFVYKADLERGRQWADIFRREAPQIDFRLWPEIGDADDVRFLAAWEPPADLQSQFRNLAAAVLDGSRRRPVRLRRATTAVGRSYGWWNRASCKAWSSM